MRSDDNARNVQQQESPHQAQHLAQRLRDFLAPLLLELDRMLDKRLVRTFFDTLVAIVRLRHRAMGLLLSELGGYLCSPAHAPAGTKRLSNLLRSPKWEAHALASFLWRGAQQRVEALRQEGQEVLLVWDESVLEKPESIAGEGLCAVRSTKALRLKHIRRGFYNPPGGRPVFVPGLHWLGALVVGRQGPPTVAAMRWWSSRGARATERRQVEETLLCDCTQAWGDKVIQIFEQGFAGSPWVTLLCEHKARFILRWNRTYSLIDAKGRQATPGRLSGPLKCWGQRCIWDFRRHCWRTVGILALSVTLPGGSEPLWLVVSRPEKGWPKPWYLLTHEPVHTLEDAWRIVSAYNRRWQIEWCWRYSKSELAMESPRLWSWARREKLLLMTTLVYAFLLSLMTPTLEALRTWLLRCWCHRTGQHCAEALVPLYRIRAALSALWSAHRPTTLSFQNSG